VLRALPEEQLPSHALDGFAALLSEWRPIAESGKPFRWSSDEEPERVQYLLNALYVAGTMIEAEAASGRARLRPALADEFHVLLVRETLGALEHESGADAQFVEQIRNVWESPVAIELEARSRRLQKRQRVEPGVSSVVPTAVAVVGLTS
jgi:hypothetical protein